jgi:HEPN domain-containing protein
MKGPMKDPDSQVTFNHVMEVWITPEVVRRQESGSIPKPYDLRAAQIIFYPDGRQREIRLNEEIRFLAKAKLKDGLPQKSKGDFVNLDDIESWDSFRLPDDEDPNCGHITLYRFPDHWIIAFDAIYNKGIASEYLSAARQFLAAAQQALVAGSTRVFVDTCFSAAELTAKALLITTPLPGENTNMSHGRIHSRYNRQANLRNVDASHKNALNRLAALRNPARYLSNPLHISEEEAKTLIRAVEDAMSFVNRRVSLHKGT